MFSSSTASVALAALCFTLQLGSVLATPAAFDGLSQKARDVLADLTPMAHAPVRRDVQDPPHFVIYADKYESGVTGPPPVADVTVRFHVHSFYPAE